MLSGCGTHLDSAAWQAGPSKGGCAGVNWEQRAVHIEQQGRWRLQCHAGCGCSA